MVLGLALHHGRQVGLLPVVVLLLGLGRVQLRELGLQLAQPSVVVLHLADPVHGLHHVGIIPLW